MAGHCPFTDLCRHHTAYSCLLLNSRAEDSHTPGVFKVDRGIWLHGGMTIEIHRRRLLEYISRLVSQLVVKHGKEESNYDVLLQFRKLNRVAIS